MRSCPSPPRDTLFNFLSLASLIHKCRTVSISLRVAVAIQTCIQLLRLGLSSPHREARLRRRELRQKQKVEEDDLAEKVKQLQVANENKQRQLEGMKEVLLHAQLLGPETSCTTRLLLRSPFFSNRGGCSEHTIFSLRGSSSLIFISEIVGSL